MLKIPEISSCSALFLDLDGTLVDSEPVHLALHRQVLEPLGVVIDQVAIERNVGTNNDVAFYRWLMERAGLGSDLVSQAPDLVAQKDQLTHDYLLHQSMPTKPGVHDLMQAINQHKTPFAVVTATKRDQLKLFCLVSR